MPAWVRADHHSQLHFCSDYSAFGVESGQDLHRMVDSMWNVFIRFGGPVFALLPWALLCACADPSRADENLIISEVIRQGAFHAIESLVRSRARRALAVTRRFGDDTLAYFTERLDPSVTRKALAQVAQRAKRNKAFDCQRFIGLALDGTGAARSRKARCALCHPIYNAEHEIVGHNHHFSMICIVGAEIVLPFDVEPYGPGDSELAASGRMLERGVEHLGPRFADYVVADGLYANAPFLHRVGKLGLRAVVRLKGNLPELLAAAEARFANRPPSSSFTQGKDRIELWDADDFDPWESLKWSTVRVLKYRQHKPDGQVVEAYWLTDFPSGQVGSRALFAMAKSRWQIENQGFNEGKNLRAPDISIGIEGSKPGWSKQLPLAKTISAGGIQDVAEAEIGEIVREIDKVA